MAIAEDASTPAVVTNTTTGAGTITSASFTPPAGALLLVFASCDKDSGTAGANINVTDSQGLYWHYPDFDDNDPFGNGYASFGVTTQGSLQVQWTTVVTSKPMTVSAVFDSSAGQGKFLAVRVITGADTYQVYSKQEGLFASSSTTSGTYSMTPSTIGSVIYGLQQSDQGTTTAPAISGTPTNITILSNNASATTLNTTTLWKQTTANTQNTSTVTVGVGTYDQANFSFVAVFEVIPAGTYTSTGLTANGVTAHSQWLYDSRLPSWLEPSRTNFALSHFEADYAIMQGWFGGLNLPVSPTIIVTGEDPQGATWNASPAPLGPTSKLTLQIAGGVNTTIPFYSEFSYYLRYLMYSELAEMFEMVQNKGWFNAQPGVNQGLGNEGSVGEGLSRLLGNEFLIANNLLDSGILTERLENYAVSHEWLNSARADYITTPTLGTPVNFQADGACLLFLYYLKTQLGYTVPQIIAAMNRPNNQNPGTLLSVYQNLINQTSPSPQHKFFRSAQDTALASDSAALGTPTTHPGTAGPQRLRRFAVDTAYASDVAVATSANPYNTFKALLASAYPSTKASEIIATNPDDPWPIALSALREDPSTPGLTAGTGNAGTITSPSFLPPAGSLLIAMVAGEWSQQLASASVSDSQGGSWARAAYVQGTADGGRRYDGGVCGIFYQYLSSAPLQPITVTANFTNISGGRYLDVRVIMGADPGNNPITGWSANYPTNSTANANISVKTTVAGSRVYGISNDAQNTDTFTPLGGTTVLNTQVNTVDRTSVASWLSITGSPGSQTLGGTWSAGAMSQVCAFEIVPTGAETLVPLPTFVDGQVPRASDFNAITDNLANLYAVVQGGTGGSRYQYYKAGGKGPIKPLTVLSITNPNFTIPDSSTTVSPYFVNFDTVLANSDNSWSPLQPNVILINTPGLYRLHAQLNVQLPQTSDAFLGGTVLIQMTVNGNNVANNTVATADGVGQAVGCSATMELAGQSFVQVAATQWNSGAAPANVGLFQFVAEWLGP